jgi:hypothetical protein
MGSSTPHIYSHFWIIKEFHAFYISRRAEAKGTTLFFIIDFCLVS